MVMWPLSADTLFWQLSIDHNMDVYHQVTHRYRLPQWLESLTFLEDHNPESATFMLGLSHDVFTDRFSFRCILQHFLPRKRKHRSVHERVINKRGDKGKPNVIKRSTKPFRGFLFWWSVCGTWKIFLIRAKIVLKINWSVKTPRHEYMGIAHSGLWAPDISHWLPCGTERQADGRTDSHVITKISRMD